MIKIIKELKLLSLFYEFERAFFIYGTFIKRTDTPKPIIIIYHHNFYKNIALSEFLEIVINDEYIRNKKTPKIAFKKHTQLELLLKENFKEEDIFSYDFDNTLINSISDVVDFEKSMIREQRLLVSDDLREQLALKHIKYCYLNFLQLCSEQETTLKLIWGEGEFERYNESMRKVMSCFY